MIHLQKSRSFNIAISQFYPTTNVANQMYILGITFIQLQTKIFSFLFFN